MRQNYPYESSPAARHYHPTLSIWLSVDPMSDKYPGVSPYTYCGNNPVKVIDPDGREIEGDNPPKWQIRHYSKIFNKIIAPQLTDMINGGASESAVLAKADELSEQYQNKRWFRMNDSRAYRSKPTAWGYGLYYHVEVYSETRRPVTIEYSRADNNQMEICHDIPLGQNDYAATVSFSPYGVENELTISSNGQTLLTTGMVSGSPYDSYQYELDISGNSSMTYCIKNSASATEDKWKMFVTIFSRKLNIHVESKPDVYRCGKRNKLQ